MQGRKQWFDEAFRNQVTRKPYEVPAKLRAVVERICTAYDIKGIADPMYIANIIAYELGLGDGEGHFTTTTKKEAGK
jgi:hypothetical protein